MPNQYRPEKRTLGNLLSTTNPPVVVPDWQRSYSWTTTEVETFWEDLVTFSDAYPGDNVTGQEYFLGSIVIVDGTDDHLLLDGQQRISTAAILLSVIRDFLQPYNQNAATRTQSRYLGDFDDARGEYSYKVTMNEYDRDYFKRTILEARVAGYVEPDAVLESHRQISKAREFFVGRFTERYASETPEKAHHWALRIQDILTNHMSVVSIFSQDEDNAAAVFETLNDRGIGLSTADLVRNLILRRAVANTRDEIIDLWREVLQVEGDAPLKTFLRHYWISHYGDVKTQSLYREIKEKIIADNVNSLELSRSLRDAVLVYRDILAGSSESDDVSRLLRDAGELGATVLFPAMLSASQTLDIDQQCQLIRALVDTFVRHSAVGRLENSRLENITYRIARELRQNRAVAELCRELKEFAPTDDQFREAFATVTVPRRDTARYVLRRLEQERRGTEELDVAPPSRVHVEHIYPQTPRESERMEGHARVVDRLGNLTLLSRRINTALRNAPFAEKKVKYGESELLLTIDLVASDGWGVEQINDRQARFANRAPSLWPILEDGESAK